MIRLKNILPLFIVLFAYSVMCEDLQEVKRLGWFRARQNYQYNHPPSFETYDVPVFYDKVIDRASRIQNDLTVKFTKNSVDESKAEKTASISKKSEFYASSTETFDTESATEYYDFEQSKDMIETPEELLTTPKYKRRRFKLAKYTYSYEPKSNPVTIAYNDEPSYTVRDKVNYGITKRKYYIKPNSFSFSTGATNKTQSKTDEVVVTDKLDSFETSNIQPSYKVIKSDVNSNYETESSIVSDQSTTQKYFKRPQIINSGRNNDSLASLVSRKTKAESTRSETSEAVGTTKMDDFERSNERISNLKSVSATNSQSGSKVNNKASILQTLRRRKYITTGRKYASGTSLVNVDLENSENMTDNISLVSNSLSAVPVRNRQLSNSSVKSVKGTNYEKTSSSTVHDQTSTKQYFRRPQKNYISRINATSLLSKVTETEVILNRSTNSTVTGKLNNVQISKMQTSRKNVDSANISKYETESGIAKNQKTSSKFFRRPQLFTVRQNNVSSASFKFPNTDTESAKAETVNIVSLKGQERGQYSSVQVSGSAAKTTAENNDFNEKVFTKGSHQLLRSPPNFTSQRISGSDASTIGGKRVQSFGIKSNKEKDENLSITNIGTTEREKSYGEELIFTATDSDNTHNYVKRPQYYTTQSNSATKTSYTSSEIDTENEASEVTGVESLNKQEIIDKLVNTNINRAKNTKNDSTHLHTRPNNLANNQYQSSTVSDTSVNLDREQASLIATEENMKNSIEPISNSDFYSAKQEKVKNIGVRYYSGSKDSKKLFSERERIQDENISSVLTNKQSSYQTDHSKTKNDFHEIFQFTAVEKPGPNAARQNDDSDVTFKSYQINADQTETQTLNKNALNNKETIFGRTVYTNIDKTLNTESVLDNFNTELSVSDSNARTDIEYRVKNNTKFLNQQNKMNSSFINTAEKEQINIRNSSLTVVVEDNASKKSNSNQENIDDIGTKTAGLLNVVNLRAVEINKTNTGHFYSKPKRIITRRRNNSGVLINKSNIESNNHNLEVTLQPNEKSFLRKMPEEKMASFEESKSIVPDNRSVTIRGQKSYDNFKVQGIVNNVDSKNQNNQGNIKPTRKFTKNSSSISSPDTSEKNMKEIDSQNVLQMNFGQLSYATKVSSSDGSSHYNNASEFQTEGTFIEQNQSENERMQSKAATQKFSKTFITTSNLRINDNTSQNSSELKDGNTFSQPQRSYKKISIVATNFTNDSNAENSKAISTIESSLNAQFTAISSEQQKNFNHLQNSKFESSGDMYQTNEEHGSAMKIEENTGERFFSTAASKSNKKNQEGITSHRRKNVETSNMKPIESGVIKTVTKQFTRVMASTSRNQPTEFRKEEIEAVESPFTSAQHQKLRTVTTTIANNSEKEGLQTDRKHSRRIISGSITKPTETTRQVFTSYSEPKIKITERPIEFSTFTHSKSKTETFNIGKNKESDSESSAHFPKPTLTVKDVFVEKPVQYSIELTPLKSYQLIQSRTESNSASWTSTGSHSRTTRFHGDVKPIVPIIKQQNRVLSQNGEFSYSYEGGDGTRVFSKGKLKEVKNNHAGEAVEGGFSYTDKDGNDFSMSYTADENGYRPVGAHLPTPPPIPIAIARALAYLATKTTPEPVTESTWQH